MPVSGSLMMSRDDWRRSWPAWLRATAIGFPFGTIPAGGAEIPTFLSYALEKKLSKHPEEFGARRNRRRGGTRGGQQCVLDRRAGAAADARHPHLGDCGDSAGGVPELRYPAGAAAVPDAGRAGVGPDRQPVRRQRAAAGAEPAADRAVGAGAEDPAAAALRGHPGVCHAGRLQPAPVGGRPDRPCTCSACSAS